MKKILTLVMSLVMIAGLVSCGRQSVSVPAKPVIDERPYSDFIEKKFGVMDGTGYEKLVESVFSGEDYIVYSNNEEARTLLENGAVDAVIGDYPAAVPWVMELGPEQFGISVVPKDMAGFGFQAMAKNTAEANDFNVFLDTLRADGTLDEMAKRWVDDYNPLAIEPVKTYFKPENDTENGTLTVGINTSCSPFVMKDKDGNPTGFEIELMDRYADYSNKSVNYHDMDFNELMPFYTSGQADYIIAMCYDISGESGEVIYFTEPYYDVSIAVVYKK
jgi:ABC-type amino acid transport substrate-binding protein